FESLPLAAKKVIRRWKSRQQLSIAFAQVGLDDWLSANKLKALSQLAGGYPQPGEFESRGKGRKTDAQRAAKGATRRMERMKTLMKDIEKSGLLDALSRAVSASGAVSTKDAKG
ncbi:MAG: hypothetical protein ACREP9_06295, partial [Candidatus Dormibacteraceae bacterium]